MCTGMFGCRTDARWSSQNLHSSTATPNVSPDSLLFPSNRQTVAKMQPLGQEPERIAVLECRCGCGKIHKLLKTSVPCTEETVKSRSKGRERGGEQWGNGEDGRIKTERWGGAAVRALTLPRCTRHLDAWRHESSGPALTT